MNIIVTGSIASDHLAVFPGKFSEQLMPDQLEHISLSFLVDDLQIRRGGNAANIAYSLGRLGLRPILVGAVGSDFGEYSTWLQKHDVDVEHVRISETKNTARFMCTTDADNNQIASFYTGAMAEAREIELAPIVAAVGGVDMVIIGPNDPEGMVRHTQECRDQGFPFAADFGQQVARMEGSEIGKLVDGAAYLFTNTYESKLLQQKTGWSSDEILAKVDTWVITHGAKGVCIDSAGSDSVDVGAVPARTVVDPTGGGDGFRAGFFAARAAGLSEERSAQVGCLLATLVIETSGPQEYEFVPEDVLARFTDAYGADAAAEVEATLLGTS